MASTVKPVLKGHPWEWISDCLIQGDHLIQVARYTFQRIRSPVLIRTGRLTSKRNIHLWRFNDLRK